jgi:superfamily I DNA and/or RNA helicase
MFFGGVKPIKPHASKNKVNITSTLILIRNNQSREYQDRTANIKFIKSEGDYVVIVFNDSPREFQYKNSNVRILRDPKQIDLKKNVVYIDKMPIDDLVAVEDFGEYVRMRNCTGKVYSLHKDRVSLHATCLEEQNAKLALEYLKELSGHMKIEGEDSSFLQKQFEKMTFISEKSVLGSFLNSKIITKKDDKEMLVFPFGFNASQKNAVERAFANSISIIEGPPGTGKTQTILNIIANVIYRKQTVAVVSGSNSATDNVYEKLSKKGYGFMAALLGNSEKKKHFFDHCQVATPELSDWEKSKEELAIQVNLLKQISQTLSAFLADRNELAKTKEQLSKLKTEQAYFLKEAHEKTIPLKSFSFRKHWHSKRFLEFFADLRGITEKNLSIGWGSKIKLFFRYGIFRPQFLVQSYEQVYCTVSKLYYENSIKEKQEKIAKLESRLSKNNFEELMNRHTEVSNVLFRNAIGKRYNGRLRKEYTPIKYLNDFQSFISDYPVILSTTHSIRNCVTKNYLFDYMIIDEASQVDLVAAALAMSCCKNIVVVGDTKQLPQVVPNDIAQKSAQLLRGRSLPAAFDYARHSILSSLLDLHGNRIQSTLLREHYRCHPKIARFCNEKFYNNELVIMTSESEDDNALQLVRMVEGSHARKNKAGWFNLRQAEVIRDEILDKNKERYGDCSTVGIVSPYREHASVLKGEIPMEKLEVDTIHKYQGREKDTIIFSTASNELSEFLDNPNLINVAVSRAVKELIVVISHNLYEKHGTNLGDLIRFIEYNGNKGAVVQSQKISVFDMLYSEYSSLLLERSKLIPKVSKHKSENLMYAEIIEVLKKPAYNPLTCTLHVPLFMIVKNPALLSEREQNFVRNPWTHVDFLIFSKMNKEPVLVVEVDGFRFHQLDEKQLERDRLKDEILKQIGLPVLRIATNASGERELLEKRLDEALS